MWSTPVDVDRARQLSPITSIASVISFFFFNDTATTEIYTLSLHDALPISDRESESGADAQRRDEVRPLIAFLSPTAGVRQDRKSTRLNSSHSQISYAVFCLKKKNESIPPSSLSSLFMCICTWPRSAERWLI